MSTTTITIWTPRCPRCHRASELKVDRAGHEAWQAGAHIQNAFPLMSADQREMLLTGTHPRCWDLMFAEPEEIDPDAPRECNGICLTGADLGVPEFDGIAHAHPDCPLHGGGDIEVAPGADPEYDAAAEAAEHDALRFEPHPDHVVFEDGWIDAEDEASR